MFRRIATIGGAIAVVGTTLVGFAGPASAVTTFTTCATAHVTQSFTPGISNTAHTQSDSITGSTLGGCSGGGVTSATLSGTLSMGSTSCKSTYKKGTVIGSGTVTVTWNSGTSTLAGKLKAGVDTLHQTFVGKVTSGKFAGTAANPNKLKVNLNVDASSVVGDCTTPITFIAENQAAPAKITSAH
jgi:hypothetical protein